jgi:hypothetical protein
LTAAPHRPFWRDPALHFLALGVGVFALHRGLGLYRARHARTPVPARVIEALRDDRAQRTGAPLTPDEVRALTERYLDDEALFQEALARGLYREDRIVRGRLVERMRASLRHEAGAREPSESELRAWLESHREHFARPATVAVEHAFLDRTRHAQTLAEDARRAREALVAGRAASDVSDASGLGVSFGPGSERDFLLVYGEGLGRRALALPTGEWSEPIESPLGVHLVRVVRRAPGELPPWESVRSDVRDAMLIERHREAEHRAVRALRERYGVRLVGEVR